jgi:hypothetical protein
VGNKKKSGEECDDMVAKIKELDGVVEAKETEQKDVKTAVDKVRTTSVK